MERRDETDQSSSAYSNYQDAASSLYSTPASIASFHQRYPSSSQSYRPRLVATVQQSIADLRSLLDILFKNEIPGPKLIRLQREFCNPLGHGGQGNVYGVSPEFEKQAQDLQHQYADLRVKYSALRWTSCVVKHLRTDQRRNDVRHAFREISRLCHPSLRRHSNIVNLIAWGISLDALESVNLDSSSTPLLILERADCDLAQFIRSEEYEVMPYELLCDLCLDIGHGLAAIHATGIVHGDLKLENVLIFSENRPTRTRWTAKLCDFGSAVLASAHSQESTSYLGSETWLPPEWYERSLVGKPMPQSLVPCDIFVYGLVVWATFIGIHFSPLYNIQKAQGHGADIVRHMGQQRFYARAKDSVTAYISRTRSDTHQLLAAFTEQTFGHFGGHVKRRILEQRQAARSLGFGFVTSGDTREDLDNKIRRVLFVLRACLNDAPERRDSQPWRYLDRKRFPFVPRVDNPQQYLPDYSGYRTLRDENPASEQRLNKLLKSVLMDHFRVRDTLKKLSTQGHQWLRIPVIPEIRNLEQFLSVFVRPIVRVLQPRNPRDTIYKKLMKTAAGCIPEFQKLGPLDYLEHEDGGEHYNIAMLIETIGLNVDMLLDNTAGPSDIDMLHHDTYAWARLRRHIKLCCWQQCDQSLASRYPSLNNYKEYETRALAWLCSGEIGQHELQQMKENPLSQIWDFLFASYSSDSQTTNLLLLLLENGCDIHRLIPRWHMTKTVFLWYLSYLVSPKEALEVAVHFHRIAGEQSVSPTKRYYLTGRLSDLTSDEDSAALTGLTFTTVLHDAVRASNYPLVEYLVKTRFNVSAKDSVDRVAFDIAMETANPTASANSIKALLQQDIQSRTNRKSSTPDPPLGWVRHPFKASQSIKAWQETSIEGDFDAITFIAPHTGLYESDRLLLGRIQGEKQIYRLDPFRFLKTPNDLSSARSAATAPLYGEEWYIEDAQAVEEPLPLDPFHDARAWIRYPAKGLRYVSSFQLVSSFQIVSTLAFVLFASFSLLARWMRWQVPELLFAGLAVSLFSFGSSATGMRIGTSLRELREITGSEIGYQNVLWSNAPELLIGISAVARGETMLTKSILTGVMLYDAVWILGISFFITGAGSHLFVFNSVVRNMISLSLLGSAFVSILVSFDISIGGTTTLSPSESKTMFLSRSIAIICLLLWAAFLLFRNRTHASLFDEELEDDDTTRWETRDISRANHVIQALIRLVLLSLCADTLVHILVRQSVTFRTLCAYFVIPLITRIWAAYRCFFRPWVPGSWSDPSDDRIDSTIGSILNNLLFVGPCLVLLGWIIKVPMNLRFSLMETILLDLTVWLISYLQGWVANFLTGAVLMIFYIMAILSLTLGFLTA